MKKLLSVLLALAMVLSMTAGAFAASLEGTYQLTIWVAEEIKDLTAQQIEAFNSSNEYGITIAANIEAVSEADAATSMITDVEAGADIFCFAQDQFARLVQAGALSSLGKQAAEIVRTSNDAGVVAAATSGDTLYAYPLTSDNGYFLYYDKSVIPEDHVDSMEAIIADCEAAQKYFAFEMGTSAWYNAAFFFATGCVSEWVTDDDGSFISVHDTFNSPEGLIAVKGMKKLVDSPFHLSSSDGASFASNAAAVVTGIWAYTTIESILGDNMGVTDLPSFEVDGVSYHLGSYNGCKLMGVKPQTDPVKGAAIHRLAQYLTGEACQMERFDARAWGPSNLAAQGSPAVQANPGLVALYTQNAYSVPQGQIHGSWWDIAKVIADDVKNATDEAGLQQALDNYYEKISSLFTMSDDEKTSWGVIGTCNSVDGFFYTDYNNESRSNWAEDIPMTADGSVWTTEPWLMEAGCEFKVRQGKSWDNAFPADNFKVEETGTYRVRFDADTCEVSLIPAE
ncbi:MAG: extracellular solute-binding protein [Clostridia bacterium]|nr:extracellular solute-binding protein [Clostridia bacterium]